MGSTEGAGFTDGDMFCANAFCKFVILPELLGAGMPPAPGLDLAIAASACRIPDASGVGAAAAGLAAPLSEIKSFGGDPVGVVDRAAERTTKIRNCEKLV